MIILRKEKSCLGLFAAVGSASHEGPSRKDNRGCEYEAYVPDMLVGRNFMIDGEVAADIADAEAAIARLNVEATSLVDTEALARILLRAESVASSRIEGLEIGARRLLRAEAAECSATTHPTSQLSRCSGTSMPWSMASMQ